jgi:hypothetical protein
VVECGLGLEDAALALSALSAVRFSSAALEVLAELEDRYRVANMGRVSCADFGQLPARAESASNRGS